MLKLSILLPPVIALIVLAFLFNAIMRKFHTTRYEQCAFGVLFGAIVVLGMTNPITLGEGVIFDPRTALVTSATVFVGPLAGAIAVSFGIICRVLIGGIGTAPGVVGLFLVFGIAVLWARFCAPKIKFRLLSDAALGAAVSSSVVVLFMLPNGAQLIATILPTLLICHVVSVVAIGLVFRRELNYFEQSKQLRNDAETDPLTNLLNRRGLMSALQNGKIDPRKGHALLYFDIDNFKQVNDTYGHGAGDAALAILAARVKDSIRDGALFSRHGGDEFSIYLPRLAAEDVQRVADRVRHAIASEPMVYDSMTFQVTISLGGFWTVQDFPIDTMISKADAQLLLAKQSGKNRVQIAFDRDQSDYAVA